MKEVVVTSRKHTQLMRPVQVVAQPGSRSFLHGPLDSPAQDGVLSSAFELAAQHHDGSWSTTRLVLSDVAGHDIKCIEMIGDHLWYAASEQGASTLEPIALTLVGNGIIETRSADSGRCVIRKLGAQIVLGFMSQRSTLVFIECGQTCTHEYSHEFEYPVRLVSMKTHGTHIAVAVALAYPGNRGEIILFHNGQPVFRHGYHDLMPYDIAFNSEGDFLHVVLGRGNVLVYSLVDLTNGSVSAQVDIQRTFFSRYDTEIISAGGEPTILEMSAWLFGPRMTIYRKRHGRWVSQAAGPGRGALGGSEFGAWLAVSTKDGLRVREIP